MDDWDRKPKDPPSVWLRLKTKGEAAKIRIAGSPMREVIVWPSEQGGKPLETSVVSTLTPGQWISIMRSPEWEIREAYILLVIDRSDNLAKIFRVSGSVYGKIRDYAKNPEWGNPTEYDLTITRTEAPGKAYWDVTPSPNKTSLMTSEIEKIKALDIAKLVPGALPANAVQPDEVDEMTPAEPLPWERSLPDKAPDSLHKSDSIDVINEDIGDEPINLDDIPDFTT